MTHVRMITLTVALAALIWFAADQLDSGELSIEAEIRPAVPSGTPLAVRIADPPGGVVRLDLVGPNAAIGALRGRLLGNRLTVEWTVDPTMAPGTHELAVLRIVANDEALLPFAVQSARPSSIQVVVDRYLTRQIPIELNPGLFKLAGEARIDPPTAVVRALESQWDAYGDRPLELSIEKDLQGQPEGTILDFVVPLPAQLGGQPASIQPKSVRVAVTLTERKARKTLRPVAIKFAISADLTQRYAVELSDSGVGTIEVEVVGPADVVNPLEAQDILGVIEVKSEHAALAGKDLRAEPKFLLPEGVRLASTPPAVEFRLVPARP